MIGPDAIRWQQAVQAGRLLGPPGERWSLLRGGVVNLWEFDYVEFWYADGRAQFVGVNQSGKSTLMTLTSLILLAGDLDRGLIDTFGDQHKSFRYYVEPSDDPKDRRDADSSTSRGWAWLEFGRQTADGPRFFTLLLYAQAKRGSQQLTRTWAVAEGSARVRDGLWLNVGSAVPPPDDLVPTIEVFRTGADYRAAVAERLWGYGRADRLEAVVRILKVLRTPHLGQRLDPDFFTEQMRDALPALDRAEVDQLAEGWDQLERLAADRDHAEEALRTVRAFVRRSWVPWVDRVIRRAADALVAANTSFDNVTRDEREARTGRERAEAELQRLTEAVTTTAEAHNTARDRYDLHLRSPAFQEASAAVDRARRLRAAAAEADARHRGARSTAGEATDAAGRRRSEQDNAAGQLGTDREAVRAAAEEVRTVAGPARLGSGLADWLTSGDVDRITEAVRRRREDLVLLRARVAGHRRATADLDRVAGRLASAEREHERRSRERQAADTEVVVELQAASDRLEGWAAGVGFDAPDPALRASWVAALTALADSAAPSGMLGSTVRTGWLDPLTAPLLERATVAAERSRLALEEADRSEEQAARIQAETDPTPTPPVRWRRRERPFPGSDGAPLWRLVDPGPDGAGAVLDTVEAALDAMGLLEAWVTADGTWVAGRDGDELVLTPFDGSLHDPAGEARVDTLERVLQPADGSDPVAGSVRRGLRAISWVPAGVALPTAYAVGADGRWQTPLAAGRVAPAPHGAELVGTAARADARARRVAELQTAASVARDEADRAAAEAKTLRARVQTHRQAADDLGDDATLVRLRVAALRAAAEADRAAEVLVAVQEEYRQAELRVGEAWTELLTAAGERGLPHDEPGLELVERAVTDTRAAVERLRAALAVVVRSESGLHAAAERSAEAQAALSVAETAAETARQRAATARLEATEADRRLANPERDQLAEAAQLEQARDVLAQTLQSLQGKARMAAASEALAGEVLKGVVRDREQAVAVREQALTDWGRPVRAGLAADRGLEVGGPGGITAALAQAAQARRELQLRDWPGGTVDDPAGKQALVEQAWNRMVGSSLIELRTMLERSGGRTVAVVDGDLGELSAVAVVVDSLGDRCGPMEAIRRLQTQVENLSAAYDRRLTQQLTELLASTFVEHLRFRLESVVKLITNVNRVLADHPTGATQTTLRLQRVPAADNTDGFAVLSALEGAVVEGSAAQQQIREFLERVIRQAQDEGRTRNLDWKQRLADLLDYRAWFAVITEYRAHSLVGPVAGEQPRAGWRPLTKQVHGQDSGGGKAVTLLQPLLATLVALYDEAPGSPRPLWLDEAFTGVDDANRAVMLDLLVKFDLDFCLAGPAALVAVRQVPAAAIWFVTRASAPAPGVDLSLALWAGDRQVNVPVPDLLEISAPPVESTDTLFAPPDDPLDDARDDDPDEDSPG